MVELRDSLVYVIVLLFLYVSATGAWIALSAAVKIDALVFAFFEVGGSFERS